MDNKDKNVKPVTEQDILELPVVAFGDSGDPIVRTEDGLVLFVKKIGIKPVIGEVLQIKVMRVLEKFGFAELV